MKEANEDAAAQLEDELCEEITRAKNEIARKDMEIATLYTRLERERAETERLRRLLQEPK